MQKPTDHKDKEPTIAEIEERKLKILEETFRLLTASVDALVRCSMIQTDDQTKKLLEQAIVRQWEARYWLTEATAYMEAKRNENTKAN